jgi:L-threonylcarbamoyladenylate synthase
LPRTSIVPDIVTAGLETVAVRVPSHPVARKIIELSGVNVAAPSANPFGEISPTLASHVLSQLGDKIDGIVDGGKSSVGIESTIIGCVNNEYVLLRPGGISREDIEAITGTLITHDNSEIITAPGTMKRHYSPNTNMILQNHTDPLPEDFQDYKKVGRLTYGSTFYNDCEIELNLSPAGDLKDAAVNLYHYMRKLDKMNLELIIADRVPQSGLGAGINDRLSRAASRD